MSTIEKQIDSPEYYEEHWRLRGGALAVDPVKQDQVRRILDMIPEEVRTVLDVGCGDGSITNALATDYRVTAVDRAAAALTHLDDKVAGLQADATALPFADAAFDLVLCAEVIEHVPDRELSRVIAELKRVAGKYLLISVPNDEKLRRRFSRCAACDHEFHLYSHFQSFDLVRLQRDFRPWRLVAETMCGVPEVVTIEWLNYLRNKLGRIYFYLDDLALTCPKCDAVVERVPRGFHHRVAGRLLTYLEKTLLMIHRPKPVLDWQMVLFRREGGGPN